MYKIMTLYKRFTGASKLDSDFGGGVVNELTGDKGISRFCTLPWTPVRAQLSTAVTHLLLTSPPFPWHKRRLNLGLSSDGFVEALRPPIFSSQHLFWSINLSLFQSLMFWTLGSEAWSTRTLKQRHIWHIWFVIHPSWTLGCLHLLAPVVWMNTSVKPCFQFFWRMYTQRWNRWIT